MGNYDLVCPFLTNNIDYALGVEFGMLFNRLKEEDRVSDYFTRLNQDQILLLASRLGFQVLEMKEHGDWFWLDMEKNYASG